VFWVFTDVALYPIFVLSQSKNNCKMKASKFNNKANRELAFSKGSTLISYSNNPGDSLREKALELHAQGRVVYYENTKKGSYLYEVNA
jgi:hypothetical protein